MKDQAFREPVILYAQRSDGGIHPVRICTTREAFKALTEGVIPLGNPAWQIAFDKITGALLDPKPEKIEEARGALAQLANLVAMPAEVTRRTIH
jgi:hypothetical protein